MKNWILIFLLLLVVGSCKQDDKKVEPEKSTEQNIIGELSNKVKQNPDSAGLRMRLINLLDSLQRYSEAIAQTDSLLVRDSLNNELWLTRAQLLEDNKDTAAAIASYIKAANIYPSAQVQLNLANLFAETKDKRALLVCENVKRMAQGREVDASCDFIAGVYYARTGNNKDALQMFDKAIIGNYTLMEAYMEKGFVYYETKNYPAALKVFETAITVNNMYADAYYWRAKCYEAMGNKNDALINYQRSLGLDKQLKEAKAAIDRLQ